VEAQSCTARAGTPPLPFYVICRALPWNPATTLQELHEQAGRSRPKHTGSRFEAPEAIIDGSFGLLFEYIRAVRMNRLRVRLASSNWPDLDVPMRVFDSPGQPRAELGARCDDQIWSAVSEEVKAATDWWEILYPSHRPSITSSSLPPISATAAASHS